MNGLSKIRVSEDDTETSVSIGTLTEDNIEFINYQASKYNACTYEFGNERRILESNITRSHAEEYYFEIL